MNNIIEQLQRDEGFVDHIYTDSVGKQTVGYGHNLDANPIPNLVTPMSQETATSILQADVDDISQTLQDNLPWISSLDDARNGVLKNMAFNMGVNGLLGFHHMLAAVEAGDWSGAVAAMKDSKWYSQVGVRAQRLARQMATGFWQ